MTKQTICIKCKSPVDEGILLCAKCENAASTSAEQKVVVQDALIGVTIEDKYRIDAMLGAGGMGKVYKATRLFIGDEVAIKVLHSDQVVNTEAIERFRREAQAAARLKHQNAVIIYDFGVSDEGLIYLVMELAQGQSLRAIIKEQGPLTPSAASEIIGQVCSALDEAHRQNIVHRDIKPDNIIVSNSATGLQAKVLDFGIAKLRDLSNSVSNLTQTGSVMGTPHYMSPEQCLGEELDGRSDIYSLGIVLYEILIGMVPFNSPTTTAVIVQHVNQPPPSLRAINMSITPAIEAVVHHALEKHRDARPQTAGTLSNELVAAVKGSTQSLSPNAINTTGQAATIRIDAPWIGKNMPGAANSFGGASSQAQHKKSKFLPIIIGIIILLTSVGAIMAWSSQHKDKTKDIEKDKSSPTPNKTAPSGMVYVPGGDFVMGNDEGDIAERPAHKVTVKPFFMDMYEVTCEDYEKFITATARKAPPNWINNRYPAGAARWPVTGVSWDDAYAYARWAGKRLPTEEEWEFAARGTDGRLYPWGNEWKSGFANMDAASVGRITDVGAYSAGVSPYGIFDIVGNAWEWTSTDLVAYPGGQLPPQKTNGDRKILRGGCWRNSQLDGTATCRIGYLARSAGDYGDSGFRCAQNIDDQKAQK